MANIPAAPQAQILGTYGKVWWGNKAISLIPQDPAEPEELCCDAQVAIQDSEVEAGTCAVKHFWQSMVAFCGTRDFLIINPLIKENQPGFNQYAKTVDTSQPIRYEQPFFKQGLWDEESSRLKIERYGKRSDDIMVIYFWEDVFMSEASIVKHLGHQYVITDFLIEGFVGNHFYKVTCEKHTDQDWFMVYDRELEGRIFYSSGTGLGNPGNILHLDPDNAKIDAYDPTDTTLLFSFGEDLSGFPVDSKYIDPDHAKWFWPVETNTTGDGILVYDENWQEDILFTFDGLAVRSRPHSRRR